MVSWTTAPLGRSPRFSPVERSDFRAWQTVLPIADLPGVVQGVVSGKAKLRRSSVPYVGGSGQPKMEVRYAFSEFSASYRSAEYDAWSCHALLGHGSSIWEIVRQAGLDPLALDCMIRSGPNAYDGLSDLMRRFCAHNGGSEVQRSRTVCDLIAPLALRFQREQAVSSLDRASVVLRAAADVFIHRRYEPPAPRTT